MRTAYFAFESMEQKGRKSNVYKNDKCTHIKNQKSRAGLSALSQTVAPIERRRTGKVG